MTEHSENRTTEELVAFLRDSIEQARGERAGHFFGTALLTARAERDRYKAMQDELAVMAADYATAAGDVATPDDWKAEAYRRLYIAKAAEEATRDD